MSGAVERLPRERSSSASEKWKESPSSLPKKEASPERTGEKPGREESPKREVQEKRKEHRHRRERHGDDGHKKRDERRRETRSRHHRKRRSRSRSPDEPRSSASSDYLPNFLRSESNSPRRKRRQPNRYRDKYYKNVEEQIERHSSKYAPVHQESDTTKPQLYWDGYVWVTKSISMKTVDPNFLSQTKKVRRVQLTNLPLYLGLSRDDVQGLVVRFFNENYLTDPGNRFPVLNTEITGKNVIVELSSVEEANRLSKLESIQLLDVKCKVIRCNETLYSTESTLATKLETAKNEAEATGIAMKVMNTMLNSSNVVENFQQISYALPCKVISFAHAYHQGLQPS